MMRCFQGFCLARHSFQLSVESLIDTLQLTLHVQRHDCSGCRDYRIKIAYERQAQENAYCHGRKRQLPDSTSCACRRSDRPRQRRSQLIEGHHARKVHSTRQISSLCWSQIEAAHTSDALPSVIWLTSSGQYCALCPPPSLSAKALLPYGIGKQHAGADRVVQP